jgi:hypothetical protein
VCSSDLSDGLGGESTSPLPQPLHDAKALLRRVRTVEQEKQFWRAECARQVSLLTQERRRVRMLTEQLRGARQAVSAPQPGRAAPAVQAVRKPATKPAAAAQSSGPAPEAAPAAPSAPPPNSIVA